MSQFDPYATGNTTAHQSHSHNTQSSSLPFTSILNSLEHNQLQFFLNQGYTRGLLKKLLEIKETYFQRCWIIDNGNGMLTRDAHKLVINHQNGSIENIDAVRRWDEVLESISTQAWVSSYLDMPIRFALLNKPVNNMPQYFTMGEGDDAEKNRHQKVQKIGQILKSIQPCGPSNLTKQLTTIHNYVLSIAHQLETNKQKISVVVATQGLPTNDNGESSQQITEDFVTALNTLSNLPVVITLRLCTDDEHIFHFYNAMIDSLHISSTATVQCEFDVLDDYNGESLEIYLKNPWVTYGISLHRFRELGVHVNVIDSLDAHLLTLDELHEFCSILFESKDNIPHPQTHWEMFIKSISSLMQKEVNQWNPVKKKFTPWIDLLQLQRIYGENVQNSINARRSVPTPNQQEENEAASNDFNPTSRQQSSPPSVNSQLPMNQIPSVEGNNEAQPIDEKSIKKNLLISWALQAPDYKALKPLPMLLGTIHYAFPPAFGVKSHSYFKKWKILSVEGLSSGVHSVMKRAHRKAKFLLHPDKLPKDLDEKQRFVCKMIWDILADAWNVYENTTV